MFGRIVRTILRSGRDRDIWPVLLLWFAALVPAGCLLWFMDAAMRNERFAARQRLADAYRGQLSASKARLQRYWNQTAAELDRLATNTPAPAAFAACVRSGIVDSVVLFDGQGRLHYPNAPSAVHSDFDDLEPKWQEANRLEYLRKLEEAALLYDAVAREAANDNASARAFQSEARCLAQSGQSDAVLRLVHDVFGGERYRHAADVQGRLIAANAELMALELSADRSSPVFQSIARRLAARLMDYDHPVLAAPQRRFLMKEARRLTAELIEFPTLAAEQLAAEMSEYHPSPTGIPAPRPGAIPGRWLLATPNHRVLALIRPDNLLAAAEAATDSDFGLADGTITLAAPDADTAEAVVTLPAGEWMPGWRLALSLKNRDHFDSTAARQTAVYLWTALMGVAAMGALALVAARLVRRQMTLARLKNDLAATVSHELKTPVSSMRVLVETLLDSETLDEPRTREYLQLIARENERLQRLIENFLAFSRMEHPRNGLHFSPVQARRIVGAAVESVRARLETPGCRLEIRIDDSIPPVLGDADALAAALVNLLENAHKYSEEPRQIVLRAGFENGRVIFSVHDNGVGIALRERKRIFQPFYQVDRRLSRRGGGCGLGLSIVERIATAHRGRVWVESQPGRGSTFTLALPAAPIDSPIPKEAIA